MASIYTKNLQSLSLLDLMDLCRKCRPEDLDGREFLLHKQETLDRIKEEFLSRDPNEVIDRLVNELLTNHKSVL